MVVLKNIDGEVLKVFEELDTLAGADLSYGEFMFADFRGMDLSDTDFTGSELYGAEFDEEVFDDSLSNLPNFTDTYFEKVPKSVGGVTQGVRFRGW